MPTIFFSIFFILNTFVCAIYEQAQTAVLLKTQNISLVLTIFLH